MLYRRVLAEGRRVGSLSRVKGFHSPHSLCQVDQPYLDAPNEAALRVLSGKRLEDLEEPRE